MALEAARSVEARRPAGMAVVNPGRALVQLHAGIVVEGRRGGMNVAFRAFAQVGSGRIDADGALSAPVSVRTPLRLALVDVCSGKERREFVTMQRVTSIAHSLLPHKALPMFTQDETEANSREQ